MRIGIEKQNMISQNIFKEGGYFCPACGGKEIKPWLQKKKGGVKYDIWICGACQSGFMNPQPTNEFLASFYSESGQGLGEPISLEEVLAAESEYPNETVDSKRLVKYAKSLIAKHQTLNALDIGSGYGFFSKAAIDEGFKVIAINPAAWENDVFEKLNGFRPIQMLFEDVDLGREKFNLVILSHVLEHFQEPSRNLSRIKSLLAPHGVLAISVPNINSIMVKVQKSKNNSCLLVPDHMTHFSKNGLLFILQRAGYEIKYHEYISRFPYNTLSNKLLLQGVTRKLINNCVRIMQGIPLRLINFLRLGFYHNIWAQLP